jgi:hypothetical protein
MQQAISTVSLEFRDRMKCAAVATLVLWMQGLSKLLARARMRRDKD